LNYCRTNLEPIQSLNLEEQTEAPHTKTITISTLVHLQQRERLHVALLDVANGVRHRASSSRFHSDAGPRPSYHPPPTCFEPEKYA
jgi:hypothetical protein